MKTNMYFGVSQSPFQIRIFLGALVQNICHYTSTSFSSIHIIFTISFYSLSFRYTGPFGVAPHPSDQDMNQSMFTGAHVPRMPDLLPGLYFPVSTPVNVSTVDKDKNNVKRNSTNIPSASRNEEDVKTSSSGHDQGPSGSLSPLRRVQDIASPLSSLLRITRSPHDSVQPSRAFFATSSFRRHRSIIISKAGTAETLHSQTEPGKVRSIHASQSSSVTSGPTQLTPIDPEPPHQGTTGEEKANLQGPLPGSDTGGIPIGEGHRGHRDSTGSGMGGSKGSAANVIKSHKFTRDQINNSINEFMQKHTTPVAAVVVIQVRLFDFVMSMRISNMQNPRTPEVYHC